MRISDWSSDVCSSDLDITRISLIRQLTVLGEEEDGTMDRDRFSMATRRQLHAPLERTGTEAHEGNPIPVLRVHIGLHLEDEAGDVVPFRVDRLRFGGLRARGRGVLRKRGDQFRSEEHTSELQSLMRISYAVFCLKKKKNLE